MHADPIATSNILGTIIVYKEGGVYLPMESLPKINPKIWNGIENLPNDLSTYSIGNIKDALKSDYYDNPKMLLEDYNALKTVQSELIMEKLKEKRSDIFTSEDKIPLKPFPIERGENPGLYSAFDYIKEREIDDMGWGYKFPPGTADKIKKCVDDFCDKNPASPQKLFRNFEVYLPPDKVLVGDGEPSRKHIGLLLAKDKETPMVKSILQRLYDIGSGMDFIQSESIRIRQEMSRLEARGKEIEKELESDEITGEKRRKLIEEAEKTLQEYEYYKIERKKSVYTEFIESPFHNKLISGYTGWLLVKNSIWDFYKKNYLELLTPFDKREAEFPLNGSRSISLYTPEGLDGSKYSGPLNIFNGVRLTFNYSTQVIVYATRDEDIEKSAFYIWNKHPHRSILAYYDKDNGYSIKYNGVNKILDINNKDVRILDKNSRVIFFAHGAPGNIEGLRVANGSDLAQRLSETLGLFCEQDHKIIKRCSVISCNVVKHDLDYIQPDKNIEINKVGVIENGFGYDAVNEIHNKNITLTQGLTLRSQTV